MNILSTPRLKLRRFTREDARALYDLDDDPEVMRYLSGGAGTPMQMIETRILPAFMAYDARRPGIGVFAALDADNEFIGWFSLRSTDRQPHEAELGYRLIRRCWGRGLATEGAAALIANAFTRGWLQRVVATTYEQNSGSIRVMEKVGMTLVRCFRFSAEAPSDETYASQDAVWEGDDVEYQLTLEQWSSNDLNQ